MPFSNPVVEMYSRLASEYDSPSSMNSCWGRVTQHSFGSVTLKTTHKTVVDVGCGAGRELAQLASLNSPDVQFIGVEPAAQMREIAIARTGRYANVRILDGSFEKLPPEDGSVDYLYSILAFHWTTDLHQSVADLARVMKPTAEMNLTFIGRHNGPRVHPDDNPGFPQIHVPRVTRGSCVPAQTTDTRRNDRAVP